MSKRLIYRHPQSGGVFGRDARISAAGPYVRVGLGAALAAQGPYNLAIDGRVAEVKQALQLLGRADGAQETRWAEIVVNDLWDEIAADEFMAMLGRHKGKYAGCIQQPFFYTDGNKMWPTMNGLRVLDLAYRDGDKTVGGAIGSWFAGCATGATSKSTLANLEAFLTGKTHVNDTVDLAIDGVDTVEVSVPALDGSWGADVSSDRPGYAAYAAQVEAVRNGWSALANATSEADRLTILGVIAKARAARNAAANAALNPGGTPGPTPNPIDTTAPAHCTQGGGVVYDAASGLCVCPPPFVLDAAGKQCGCPTGTALDAATNTCKKTDSLLASLGLDAVPSWIWVGAAGLGLAVLMAKSKKSGKGGKKKRQRQLHPHHYSYWQAMR
jgi:hypothetical protein